MTEKIIKAEIDGADIVIRVPIDGFVLIVENDPEYKYSIINRQKFAKEIVFEINEGLCNPHTGLTQAEQLFKDAYEKVAEGGDDDIITSEEHEFIK